ncbi:hypothetical protein PR048_020907 [Dryococelus australis]|uniref:Uncharacterized protein n=1 Tax=Dryococelus australis TaxID=614101 RepID=A0ABQ9GWR0_9NEOP|nr:hypothetical protein PR048_020907 [Dryococelus australis]
MGYCKDASIFGVPQTTLKCKLRKLRSENNERRELIDAECVREKLGPKTTVFFYRGRKEVSSIRCKVEAGADWRTGFLKSNPDLSIRIPEHTSVTRAEAFNKENVSHSFTPNRIYNCDKSGISVVSQSTSKMIATRKEKSADKAKTVSIELYMNAVGTFMPPMLVYH